jgi:menaquinone-dependent protoporphyrinogen oxidase
MKTLIVYATKSGGSRECAELLADKIKDCSIYDLSEQAPNIEDFDTVVLGSGVRMGKIYKPVKKFIENNMTSFRSKKTAFFLCNSYMDTFQKVVEKNIPKELIDRSIGMESFGGIPPFTKPKNSDWILQDHVNRLVQAVTSKG